MNICLITFQHFISFSGLARQILIDNLDSKLLLSKVLVPMVGSNIETYHIVRKSSNWYALIFKWHLNYICYIGESDCFDVNCTYC